MHVVEDDDERPLGGQKLEQPPDRSMGAVALVGNDDARIRAETAGRRG